MPDESRAARWRREPISVAWGVERERDPREPTDNGRYRGLDNASIDVVTAQPRSDNDLPDDEFQQREADRERARWEGTRAYQMPPPVPSGGAPAKFGFEVFKAPDNGSGLKDSGARRDFSTGAVRDRGVGDEKKFRRYDLLPPYALYRWARHTGKGAAKYEARNWEKGMPLSEFYNSAIAHLTKAAAGYTDEDHLDAALWNVGALVEGKDRIRRGMWPKEFDDLGTAFAGQEPNF